MSEAEKRLTDIIWECGGGDYSDIKYWYYDALKLSPEELRLLADWKEEQGEC